MTLDRRTRRGGCIRRGRGRTHPSPPGARPGRFFVARRATFSLVVLSMLLITAVAAVAEGLDRHSHRTGAGSCPAVVSATATCAPTHSSDVPAASRR